MMIERISNFRMVRTVSEGDKGALLHAVSEKSGERVAVRLHRGEGSTEELELRFKRAVRVARLLAHPAVVRLIQAGRLPDGSVFVIQEQLPGELLSARLANRARLPMNELLRLGRQIATVLCAAHARGIIHGALRPEALQLVPDPEAIGGERVKITDWGQARVPPPPATPDPAQPALEDYPGEAPKTPLDAPTYLSPEQCSAATATDKSADAADSASFTDRADVYALGIVLFQMAAGQPPFSGRAPSEIIALHIAALPPKLEQRGVPAPSALGTLVATMLIKEPAARPTMREVEERLQRLAAQQQLAQTMTPASNASPQELAQALPSNSVTIQMRAPAEPPAAQRRSKALHTLAFALGVVGLLGLWKVLGMTLDPTPVPSEGATESSLAPPAAGVEEPPLPAAPRPPRSERAAVPVVVAPAAPGPAAPVARGPVPAAAGPAAVVPTSVVPTAPGPTAQARVPVTAVSPPAPPPVTPPSTWSWPGLPPLRDLRTLSMKVPARTLSGTKKTTPAKPTRSPEAVAQTKDKLQAAQTAFQRRDYALAIDGASALLTQEPESAGLLLGQAACATNNLTLASRAYATLRARPAALAALIAECKQYSIELGVSGQFVRTKLR